MSLKFPKPEKGLSHARLVKLATRWLISHGHAVVITEMAGSGEEPDALGWTMGGESTLVECKASRSDFLHDRKKCARQALRRGMGERRLYLAPRGMLKADELPAGWGLLEVHDFRGRSLVSEVHGLPWCRRWPQDENAELRLLLSAMRRCPHRSLPGVSCKWYVFETGNRARVLTAVGNE